VVMLVVGVIGVGGVIGGLSRHGQFR
jgi:hypothetical protein